MAFQVLLYYCFTELDNPHEFAAEHRQLCESLGLKGRILLATEGINGTVSGPETSCDQYREALSSHPAFAKIEFKIDEAEGHAFKGLQVKVRDEIITLGVPLEKPVHESTAAHLSPVEWRTMMGREDVVLLDGRNDYESELGHFEGALIPPIESFRDLPAWILDHREHLEGKKILTYCTGGIRCEKLTAWMLAEGFSDVYQLDGGIVKYGKDPHTEGLGFEGMNVVFDDRVLVPPGPHSAPITHCRECGMLTANYVNCANVRCNIRLLLCPECEESTQRCCSDKCRSNPALREKNQRLAR